MAHKHRCYLTIKHGWSPEEPVDFRSKVVEIVTVGSLNIKNPISRKMLKGQTTRETGRSRRGRPNMTDEAGGKFNLEPHTQALFRDAHSLHETDTS